MTEDTEHHTAAWHETRAADLLRDTTSPGDGLGLAGTVRPTPADVERARAHAALAQSMRLGDIARAVAQADRRAATRARAEARRR